MADSSLYLRYARRIRGYLNHLMFNVKLGLLGIQRIHHNLNVKTIFDHYEKIGWFNSRTKKKAIDFKDEPLPWFTYPAISFLGNLNLQGTKILELGAGNSTFWFAKQGAIVRSIESNFDFYSKMKTEAPSNVNLIFEKNLEQLSNFNQLLSEAQIVVIDSIHRIHDTEHLYSEMKKLTVNNLQFIIFDNSERYPKLIKSLTEKLNLIQIDFIGLGPINDYEWSTSILLDRKFEITNKCEFTSISTFPSHVNNQLAILDASIDLPEEEKVSYSLNNIDLKLNEVFGKKENGFFVELGANDGISQSNSLYFEKYMKWSGILIEPILEKFQSCVLNRSPRNSYANAACVSNSFGGESMPMMYSNLMTVGLMGESDILDRVLHAKTGEKFLGGGASYLTKSNVRTLTSILEENLAPNTMDLLSLDVEGSEMEVLKGLDHSKYRFEYICLECREIKKMESYLLDNDYILVEQLSSYDYLFKNSR
jgi:FkbM family methyltransferase